MIEMIVCSFENMDFCGTRWIKGRKINITRLEDYSVKSGDDEDPFSDEEGGEDEGEEGKDEKGEEGEDKVGEEEGDEDSSGTEKDWLCFLTTLYRPRHYLFLTHSYITVFLFVCCFFFLVKVRIFCDCCGFQTSGFYKSQLMSKVFVNEVY